MFASGFPNSLGITIEHVSKPSGKHNFFHFLTAARFFILYITLSLGEEQEKECFLRWRCSPPNHSNSPFLLFLKMLFIFPEPPKRL